MEVLVLLRKLLASFDPAANLNGIPADLEITGVRDDSRHVQRGDLFIARPGNKTDGQKFIADAYAKGAAAVVTQTKIPSCILPQIMVPDAGAAASVLANLFHGSPSTKVKVLGVTGTNGKTTSTYLIRHLLGKVKMRCGMIGTVEI